jgi:hypothetical protein
MHPPAASTFSHIDDVLEHKCVPSHQKIKPVSICISLEAAAADDCYRFGASTVVVVYTSEKSFVSFSYAAHFHEHVILSSF